MSMKVISIINLKGGVAKTISAINIAHIFATIHNKRVLIVDNDKQGNTSKLFGVCDLEKLSIADVMLDKHIDIKNVIVKTQYENLDIIQANMDLLSANLDIIKNKNMSMQEQVMILKNTLDKIKDEYDYCIIDNPPDINITVMNALVTSDDVLIPIRLDKFTLDGMEELMDQIENIKIVNQNLKLKGCFITQFAKNKMSIQKEEELRNNTKYPIFKTLIRRSIKIEESTFVNMPILEHSKRCNASKDYIDLVEEYLKEV